LNLAAQLIKNKHGWMRRFGLVMIIPLTQKSFKGELDVREVLRMIEPAKKDKNPYVKKAVAWVLRELKKVR